MHSEAKPPFRSSESSNTCRLLLASGMMLFADGMVVEARAGCSSGGSTYTCSGASTGSHSIGGSNLDLLIDGTFELLGNGKLTFAESGGGISIEAQAGSKVSTNSVALQILNTGNGPVTLNSAGTFIVGESLSNPGNPGVTIQNGATGQGITVTQTEGLFQGNNGLFLNNSGSGPVNITTAGDLTGKTVQGIRVLNQTTTATVDTTIEQTAGTIAGRQTGIYVYNQGLGGTSVTTAGAVSGTSQQGIWLANTSTSAGDDIITQNGGTISSGQYGIYTTNQGSGDTTITQNAGSITTGDTGIHTTHLGSGDILIDQADGSITGGNRGMNVTKQGAGTLTINMDGAVAGTNIGGVYASTIGSAGLMTITQGNTGTISGRNLGLGISSGSDAIIDLAGEVATTSTSNSAYGVSVSKDATGDSLSIVQTSGTITGGGRGIHVDDKGTGATAISTAGTVTGTGQYGISLLNTTNSTGAATIDQSAGSITGGSAGLYAQTRGSGDLAITQTAGSIAGGEAGITVDDYGTGGMSVTTAGTVSGSSRYGVQLTNRAGATGTMKIDQTAGTITGGFYGIYATNRGSAATVVDLAGTVEGTTYGGVYTYASSTTGNLVITQANTSTITGITTGIYADAGSTTALDIAGDVTATSTSGEAIRMVKSATSGDLTLIQTEGTISGGGRGITVDDYGTGLTSVTTAGTIIGSNQYGIYVDNGSGNTGGIAVNQTSGAITGRQHGIYVTDEGSGDITIGVAGTVSSTADDGINATNRGAGGLAITQSIGSSITGNDYGLSAINQGTGTTTIDLAGTVTGTRNYGASVNDAAVSGNLALSQADTSTITGEYGGVQVTTNNNAHTTIDLAGTVAATNAANGIGAYLYSTFQSTTGELTFTQAAGSTITGGYDGIQSHNEGGGNARIELAGTVEGTTGHGVLAIRETDTSDLVIFQTSGSISGGMDGVNSNNWGVGDTTIDLSGTVTGGSGAGLQIDSFDGASVAVDLRNGASVSATSGIAIQETNGNATVTLADGAEANGQIALGNGNDAVVVENTADLATITSLDGGDDRDAADGFADHLTLRGGISSLSGSFATNWETITLDATQIALSDGGLVAGLDDGYGVFLTNNALLSSTSMLDLDADLTIDLGSALEHAVGGTIAGDVNNAGRIHWQNLGQTLTVAGNYTGVPGSVLSLETVLEDDSSATDRMHVLGDTSGTSAIEIRPAGGGGAQTVNGIQIVQVDGTSAADSFVLAAPVQAGAYEYVLEQGNALDANDWYLVSYHDCTLDNSCPPPTPPFPIYRPGVSDYVSGQTVNVIQGFQQLTSLNQRIGEQEFVNPEGFSTWVRPYHYASALDGDSRFGYLAATSGIQIGHDLSRSAGENGTATRTALTFDIASSAAQFHDHMRPQVDLSAHTGSLDALSLGLGATYTYVDHEDGYLDLVGQASFLRNDFTDSYGGAAIQHGWRAAMSAEIGKPLIQLDKWWLEPQIQLAYQHVGYQGFNDSTSHVDGYGVDALRGRIGLRFFADSPAGKEQQTKYYGTANVLHDFLDTAEIVVDGDRIGESYDRTSAELGLGLQHQLHATGYLFGDARYSHSLHGTSKQFAFQLGVRGEF